MTVLIMLSLVTCTKTELLVLYAIICVSLTVCSMCSYPCVCAGVYVLCYLTEVQFLRDELGSGR